MQSLSHPVSGRRSRAVVVGCLAAGLLVLASGCGAASTSPGAAPTPGATAATSRTATVTITSAKGCTSSAVDFPAGALTFAVTNQDATAVSEVELLSGERIVGEKENIPPGFSGTFAVTVDAGQYTLYCPGASPENTALTVSGQSASAGNDTVEAALAQGTTQYATYVSDQLGYLVQSAKALQVALQGGSLANAQQAYEKARPYYEKIEPVAESFTVGTDNLDADIDARANDVPAADWGGFHRIEKGLFADKSLTGLSAYGAGLVTNVEKLQKLTTGLTYKPFELANGAQELLDEVSSSKITGEEERYSHIDLLDFQANDEGAEQAFASLQPGLQKIDPALTATITSAFTALNTDLDAYRTGKNASGFVLYTELTTADKHTLAAAVKAVQEPLSTVASKVATA